MATREIDREDWGAFLDTFSKGHERWSIRLEVSGGDIGAQTEFENMPLLGISSDTKSAGEPRVEVTVADRTDPNRHSTYAIVGARGVWVKESDEGAAEVLEFEATDGTKAVLTLLSGPESREAIPEDVG